MFLVTDFTDLEQSIKMSRAALKSMTAGVEEGVQNATNLGSLLQSQASGCAERAADRLKASLLPERSTQLQRE